MDRDRLKEVRQTDLTESKINEDFLDWLKNKGPSWLLIILVGICAFLAIHRFRTHQQQREGEAQQALNEARLPGAFQDVAEEFEDVGQIATLARLGAAEMLLHSVQTGRTIAARQFEIPDDGGEDPEGTDPAPVTDELLTEEERENYLARADGLYDQVLEKDDQSKALAIHMVSAMNRKAAIAEARGDLESAKEWYLNAADRAGDFYPGLALQAGNRAATVDDYGRIVIFRPYEEVKPERAGPIDKKAVPLDEDLKDLIMPADDDETGP